VSQTGTKVKKKRKIDANIHSKNQPSTQAILQFVNENNSIGLKIPINFSQRKKCNKTIGEEKIEPSHTYVDHKETATDHIVHNGKIIKLKKAKKAVKMMNYHPCRTNYDG
jgi:hypothetical protein